MQIIDGAPVYSATDLVGFLECEHLTNLDRAAVVGLVDRPKRTDDQLDLIAKRGLDHEHRYLETLRSEGRAIVEIERDGSGTDQGTFLRAAAADTEAAMRTGADVIYQATFFDGTWRGHADFLHRIEEPSVLGAWSYAVADTKLARKAKAGALLQMCVYSDLLEQVQGHQPPWMEVALGGSARAIERFRVDDHMAYYRRVRGRFLALLTDSPPEYPVTATYPEPVEHCGVCRWAAACATRRRHDDHLSLVAGITKRQREALEEQGIRRLDKLAVMPIPVRPAVKGLNDEPTERIREQARLQLEARAAGKVLFELLDPIEAKRGLALLPPPSPGDLFFDMEGDPFVEEGGSDGLEYLFGVIEPGTLVDGKPRFHAFWGTDRAGERQAFEAFVDLVMDRWRADPGMHIYHYGDYEPSRVKRLMGLHATREEEVDSLLRGERFVNLYRVVQQGVRVSQESYSIKKLEPLYGLHREVSLQDAGSSIVRFEQWLDSGRSRAELLELIERYNEDDCVSNLDLRTWLEARRDDVVAGGTPVPRPEPEDVEVSPELTERQAAVEALVQRLEADIPADGRTPAQQATWLVAQLIDWHRREAKALWWRFYAVQEMTDEELMEDREAIASVTYEGVTGSVKRSLIHRYRFAPQENRVRDGAEVRDPATGKVLGKIWDIDQIEGWFELTRGSSSAPHEPSAIFPFTFIDAVAQKDALMALGSWVAEHGIDEPGPWRSARDLLLRSAPRVGQVADTSLRDEQETGLAAAIRLGLALDHSVLAIQGPPGSGKTYTGSHMIVELVQAGRRVGVTANSHKVIGNLLDAVHEAATEAGVTLAIGQKPGMSGEPTCTHATAYGDNGGLAAALRSGEIQVAGGTTWVWADPQLQDSVDVLFIDEAGQLSLANTVAISGSAESLVLLGDPRQLEQPIQGAHPPGAERSALEHLLGDHQTIPPDLGLFLPDTRRLSPAICDFTSEMFYEGRLGAWVDPTGAWDQGRQRVDGDDALSGSGIRWVAVEHEGNINDAEEEADVIVRMCGELLGRTWVDAKGVTRVIDWDQILVVAPYNAQVAKLAHRLGRPDRVGTVDKFQGREAAVSIYSLTTSSADLAPRGMDFLYSANRLNVATSRARALAIVVGSPKLLDVVARTPTQMRLANALCRLVEVAG
ncbi:MAG: TM0106 family RecB-like putative nuclease [Chloroflexi bacterium]|nr:TM0106 family RecB-like putative nuclease [Chloroflexota bacterium]